MPSPRTVHRLKLTVRQQARHLPRATLNEESTWLFTGGTGGRIGSHLPGWTEARILLVDQHGRQERRESEHLR